jgi:hypothetical protein
MGEVGFGEFVDLFFDELLEDGFSVAVLQEEGYDDFGVDESLGVGDFVANVGEEGLLLWGDVVGDGGVDLMDHGVLVADFYSRHQLV